MVFDGKKLAEKIKTKLKKDVQKYGLRPGLASILIGDDPASALYISIKERAAKKVGIYFRKYLFPINKNLRIINYELEIINLINKLNRDSKIHGILIQLPLPKGLNTNKIIHTVNPKKDVDGFHPENIKLIEQGKPRFISPPHGAILELLKNSRFQIPDSRFRRFRAIILANSKTFAEPLKFLLEKQGIKTQIAYSLRIRNYELGIMKGADLIIVAKGKSNFITAPMVKKGAIVIDVGTNKVGGKLVGDVDFLPVARKASFITPVPGGVGPMTVAMLLKNVFLAAKKFSGA